MGVGVGSDAVKFMSDLGNKVERVLGRSILASEVVERAYGVFIERPLSLSFLFVMFFIVFAFIRV